MAVRKTSGKMQKTLKVLKQDRDVIAEAITQLQSVLDVLKGGGAKKRGRPKKVTAKLAKRGKTVRSAKKTSTKKTTRKAKAKVKAKKAPGRRKKRQLGR